MRKKEYTGQTIGMSFPGHVESAESAFYMLHFGSPRGTVVIRETVRVSNDIRVPEKHPMCTAPHVNKPVEWVTITGRAFPNVLPEHQEAVRRFGRDVRTVVVPVVEPTTANWEEKIDNVC